MLWHIPTTCSNASHLTSIQLRTFKAAAKSSAKPSKRKTTRPEGSTGAPKAKSKAKRAKSAKPATAS